MRSLNGAEDFERVTVASIATRIKRSRLPKDDVATAGQARQVAVPGTLASFELRAVPAGDCVLGSAASDLLAQVDELPQITVPVAPFYMQAHPVTWDQFQLFQFAAMDGDFLAGVADAITRPTRPYIDMSYGMGTDGCPAIGMTQHAANKYAQWLSALTGEFFRLPTEAEWEWACRAGSTSPFFFGSDAAALDDFAWYDANSEGRYHPVGEKSPNAWGLFDMLGNVCEWTLDQYAPYGQERTHASDGGCWVKATEPHPLVVRGGYWADEAVTVRCAARLGSEIGWKRQDPQLPKSIWYLTDGPSVGFRLVRPLTVPSEDEMYGYWNSGVEYEDE